MAFEVAGLSPCRRASRKRTARRGLPRQTPTWHAPTRQNPAFVAAASFPVASGLLGWQTKLETHATGQVHQQHSSPWQRTAAPPELERKGRSRRGLPRQAPTWQARIRSSPRLSNPRPCTMTRRGPLFAARTHRQGRVGDDRPTHSHMGQNSGTSPTSSGAGRSVRPSFRGRAERSAWRAPWWSCRPPLRSNWGSASPTRNPSGRESYRRAPARRAP